MLEAAKNLLLWAARWDIWSLSSLGIVLCGFIAGYWKFYRPRKSIRNLLVYFHCERAPGWNFPLRILVSFSNHTGKSVHISSASFKGRKLKPDPNFSVDLSTGKIPLKFPRESIIEGKTESDPTVAFRRVMMDLFNLQSARACRYIWLYVTFQFPRSSIGLWC
jgi:hypothetical protein